MNKFILLVAFLTATSSYGATLEDLFNGFERCTFKGAYYDIHTQKVPNSYFEERNLKPYKLEDSLAYYSVKDSFYGIPVSEIIIPITFDLHVLVFDMPLSKVAAILHEKSFHLSENTNEIENGDAPALRPYKNYKDKSTLYCNERIGGVPPP